MSPESSRRLSNTPSSIPRAPPLPAPKSLQWRARDAAYKLVGYGSRPPSPSPQIDAQLANGLRGRYANLGASQNANVSHRTGLEINTIAINEKGTHALLGGKEIFKTVKFEDGICVEDLNLRTAIRSTPTQASGKPRQVYSIDIADVAWAKGDCGNYVAAATSSGKIILYDLGHAGIQAAQLHEHVRQVHKVTFNPHKSSLLLSGSQDGTVRLWDVRQHASDQASTLQSKRKYSGQSDGVRDVKWSPTDGVDFAFGTDSGWIQSWDIRNLKTAKVKIPAHTLSCNSIDWHPDGKHIASAGSDKAVRVWDFSAPRRQKAVREIRTPFPVLNARWRPSCESSMLQSRGARQCTQLVTSYDTDHPVIHIWDLRRPALPFREMVPYPSAPTDLLWHSQDLLWTVGREGILLQQDIQHAPKVVDKRNLQAFAVSPSGDVNLVVQRRTQLRRPELRRAETSESKTSTLTTGSETSFFSRSWQDDSLESSFLVTRPRKIHARSDSNTKVPHARGDGLHANFFLDDILHNRLFFKPEQAAARGLLPYHADPEVFAFLARTYIAKVQSPAKVGGSLLQQVKGAFQGNEISARAAGLYRIAQSWKILGFVALNHLREWEAMRIGNSGSSTKEIIAFPGCVTELARGLLLDATPKSLAPVRPISLLTQQLNATGMSSNNTTPLATPVQLLTDLHVDDLILPPLLGEVPVTKPSNHSAKPAYPRPDARYVDLEEAKPFKLVEMLSELVNYHVGKGDALNAATMLLLLTPLLPRTHPLPAVETERTVTRYAEALAGFGHTSEAVLKIFERDLEPTMLAGLQPLQIESILSTYHDQLLSHRLFGEAAHVRKWAYPTYPAVYEDYVKDVGLRVDGGRMSSCPICFLNDCPFGETSDLLSACLLCGHSGHAGCFDMWFRQEKQSACPTQNCLCDCALERVVHRQGTSSCIRALQCVVNEF